jgi:hypothetical protein
VVVKGPNGDRWEYEFGVPRHGRMDIINTIRQDFEAVLYLNSEVFWVLTTLGTN